MCIHMLRGGLCEVQVKHNPLNREGSMPRKVKINDKHRD